MTTSVLVPLASGFEEIEAITIIDVLRRAGVDVVTASLGDPGVDGAHGIRVLADTTLEAATTAGRRYDAVVLPGGMPGAANLRDDQRVHALTNVVEKGGTAAAICAAPIALEKAGLLAGRNATAYPSFREQLTSAAVQDERVVTDGPIVTGAGPGAALEFALALVERFVSVEQADTLRAGMLVR